MEDEACVTNLRRIGKKYCGTRAGVYTPCSRFLSRVRRLDNCMTLRGSPDSFSVLNGRAETGQFAWFRLDQLDLRT